ncbi:hypothetical protein D3C87_1572540 [compost metagenome]
MQQQVHGAALRQDVAGQAGTLGVQIGDARLDNRGYAAAAHRERKRLQEEAASFLAAAAANHIDVLKRECMIATRRQQGGAVLCAD